jgi:hypothetical protein
MVAPLCESSHGRGIFVRDLDRRPYIPESLAEPYRTDKNNAKTHLSRSLTISRRILTSISGWVKGRYSGPQVTRQAAPAESAENGRNRDDRR